MQVMGSGEVRSAEYEVRSTENGVGGTGYGRAEYGGTEYVTRSKERSTGVRGSDFGVTARGVTG